MNIPIPGSIFRHYKGGRYIVTAVAESHNHNGALDVIYISLKLGKYRTRPLFRDSRKEDAWTDKVMWPDGISRNRFIPDDSHTLEFFTKMFPDEPGGAVYPEDSNGSAEE